MKLINAMFSKVNGGLEQVFLNYNEALRLHGCEVISVIHPDAAIKDSCSQDNLVMIHNYNQYDFLAIRKLRRLIEEQQPDCIITHSYRAAYLFKKTKTKVPKVAVCHVKSHFDFGTEAIIALTDTMRQEIIDAGKSEHTVFTVPNMISIPPHVTYRKPNNKGIPTLGVCARFASIKGVDIFIKALAELKRRGLSFKAKIAGDGPEKESYLQLIRQYLLEDAVELLGWVENKQSFYEQIDIFCLSSREEAFGLVILEAMMHSLPMVLSNLVGPQHIVADTQSALLVPSENPIALADGLERIIKDKNFAETLSWNAFHRAYHFSNQRMGAQLVGVLRQVCVR